MPHLFANRPRYLDLTRRAADAPAHFAWERFNAAVYNIGGVLFIVGSALFLPRLAQFQDIGALLFLVGSLFYLVVTGHDMAEVLRVPRHSAGIFARLERLAAGGYLAGTLLFTVGSVLFMSYVGLTIAGAWCFVTGSLLFVLGAAVNVLQIVQARSLLTLQLMNLTAVSFLAGSVLFTVASIPYLWTVSDAGDQFVLDRFLACQYLAGSALFLLGGVFNYRRAWLLLQGEAASRPLL